MGQEYVPVNMRGSYLSGAPMMGGGSQSHGYPPNMGNSSWEPSPNDRSVYHMNQQQHPPLPSLRGAQLVSAMPSQVARTPHPLRTGGVSGTNGGGGSSTRIIQHAMSAQTPSYEPSAMISAAPARLIPVSKDLHGGTASLTAISAAAAKAKASKTASKVAKAAPPAKKKPRVKLLPPAQEKAIVGNLLAVLRPGFLLDQDEMF